MKAREVVLLVFIIAAGIFFYHARTGKLDFDWEDYVALDWNAYDYEESHVVEPPLPPALKVINAHGNVEIRGTEGDKITFTFKKKIWRRNEERARQVAEKLHPIVAKDDSFLNLSTNRDEFKKRNFETSFILAVPLNMDIDVRNSYGLVKAEGVGKAAIFNRHGKVSAAKVAGELKLENSYEDVDVEAVQSNCWITSKHSTILARGVTGEMDIDHSHGKIRLKDIAQKTTIDAPHTEISGEDLPGSLDIRNSYEKISLSRVGLTMINSRHAAVDIDDITGNLEIRDDYGRIKLNRLNGNLWVSGKHLAVHGRAIGAEEIYISSSYEDIELIDFSGKTTVLLSHGKVSLTPLPVTAAIEVRCDYSPITLYWPAGEKYPLEAQTKNGDIFWRLPGNIAIEEQNSLTRARAFADLVDKPRLFLSTTYSDIRIEEGFPK
ncbi:MAG: hypothetical protein QHH14_04775 [Clostridiales bacterium]|nr:hypothetical protein [Clostridiales bacterium]